MLPWEAPVGWSAPTHSILLVVAYQPSFNQLDIQESAVVPLTSLLDSVDCQGIEGSLEQNVLDFRTFRGV